MARRLVERGVPWDHHADVMGRRISAAQIDGPIATLVQDLKQRGLRRDTRVINLGEFRLVHNGQDHNIYGFTVLLAGAGVKAGMINGKTDDFGFKVAENPVHVHDLQATLLHLLGLDHEKLAFR